jgi:hypothetical protein
MELGDINWASATMMVAEKIPMRSDWERTRNWGLCSGLMIR